MYRMLVLLPSYGKTMQPNQLGSLEKADLSPLFPIEPTDQVV
jgi:hypothetical protein